MQNKIAEIKTLHSQEIEAIHRHYHQQMRLGDSHNQFDRQTQTDYCTIVPDTVTATSQQQVKVQEKQQIINTTTTCRLQLDSLENRSDSDTNIMLPSVVNTDLEDVPISQLLAMTTTSNDCDGGINTSLNSITSRGGRKETEVVGLKIRADKRAAKIFTSHAHVCSRTL